MATAGAHMEQNQGHGYRRRPQENAETRGTTWDTDDRGLQATTAGNKGPQGTTVDRRSHAEPQGHQGTTRKD